MAIRLQIVAIATVLLAACNSLTQSETGVTPDYWPTSDWRTSAPEQQGMNSTVLAEMLATIESLDLNIDSVLVVRNGYLVLDAYVYPFDRESTHIIYSCTKSIVSALIGIAIDHGHIEGIDTPIVDLFPDYTPTKLDDRKRRMTLEDVLTMSTGLSCEDSYLYRWRGLDEMRQSKDWIQFMLDLPMRDEPGSRFEYCNGGSFLLSALIQEKTGKSALEYGREHLFAPLGITDVAWDANLQGINIGWSGLHMRPRDMAKIGYLYLNEGRWDGSQIVPSEWVAASTRSHVEATLQDGYGYQWWVDSSGIYMALGYAGQFIYVVPKQEIVVVFTSDLPEEQFYEPQRLLMEHILPAAESKSALPADPDGVALLQERARALASP